MIINIIPITILSIIVYNGYTVYDILELLFC